MKIGLIGAGRLGICLALLIEKAGYEVLASDNRIDYIKDLQKGIIDMLNPKFNSIFLMQRTSNLQQIIFV